MVLTGKVVVFFGRSRNATRPTALQRASAWAKVAPQSQHHQTRSTSSCRQQQQRQNKLWWMRDDSSSIDHHQKHNHHGSFTMHHTQLYRNDTSAPQQQQCQVSFSFPCRKGRGSNHGDDGRGSNDDDEKLALLQPLCEKGHLDRALDVLSRMDTAPSTHIYLLLLKACSKSKDLTQAKRVYAHLAQHSTQLTSVLADYLVFTLAKCGAIEDARCISDTLPHLTVFSWTAMISAYVESGDGQEAFRMHEQMQGDGVEPSNHTFVSLFKACGIVQDLEQGKKLHAAACMKGFVSDVFVGSTLVSMYGKCGAIVEAENVFCALSTHDVVSWNAMLSAYLDQGQGDKALQLYRQMQDEGMSANQLTLVMALQACGYLAEKEETCLVKGRLTKMMSLEIGQALHADARRKGFALDVFVNNTLVSMYGKTGAVMEAEVVFGGMSHRDFISWNAMHSAYIENSEEQKTLWLYRLMQQEDVSVDVLTLVFALQACGTLSEEEQGVIMEGRSTKMLSLEIGQALHADACAMDFTSDLFLGTTLLSMYGMCGAIMEAENVFLALSQRDRLSWSAMLSAYIKQGQGEKALQLYRQMQEEGVSANPHTLMFALQACGKLAEKEEAFVVKGRPIKAVALEIGQALHVDAHRKDFANVFISNTLVSMYGKCGAIVEAEDVFAAVLVQGEVVSWNAMLSAYVEQGQGDKALQLYRGMQEKGISPNQLTFVMALQACGTLAEKEKTPFVKGRSKKVISLEIGEALHADAGRKGFASNVLVGSTLVSMYGKCGAVLERDNVFGALSCHGIISWNAMLFACVEEGQAEQALCLYRQVQEQSRTLDDATLICILQACSTTGSLEICKQLHFDIVSARYEEIPSVAATLIHAYGSCASMADMQAFFDELLNADIVSWNACIAGRVGEGNFVASVEIFEKLKQAAMKPDEVTFTSVLSACSHHGLVVKGSDYFESMTRNYSIAPNSKHYGVMVDLFGRAGDFRRVENMLGRMPMEADLSIWLCLLGACHKHGNLELAEWAFEHAVSSQPKQATFLTCGEQPIELLDFEEKGAKNECLGAHL